MIGPCGTIWMLISDLRTVNGYLIQHIPYCGWFPNAEAVFIKAISTNPTNSLTTSDDMCDSARICLEIFCIYRLMSAKSSCTSTVLLFSTMQRGIYKLVETIPVSVISRLRAFNLSYISYKRIHAVNSYAHTLPLSTIFGIMPMSQPCQSSRSSILSPPPMLWSSPAHHEVLRRN